MPPVGDYDRGRNEAPHVSRTKHTQLHSLNLQSHQVRTLEIEGDVILYRRGPIDPSSLSALVSASGGVGQILDYNAGANSQPADVQTRRFKEMCPLVAPGGLCAVDGLFEQPNEGARWKIEPGGAYASLRDLAGGLLGKSVHKEVALLSMDSVAAVAFTTNNCVVLKQGTLQAAGRPEPNVRYLQHNQDESEDESSQDEHDEEDEF